MLEKCYRMFVASEEGTPDSRNPSVVENEEEEEGGLPSPPLDEGAFFVAPTGTIELSQVYICLSFFPSQTYISKAVYMKLNLGFSLCCIYLDDVKFFDGMDDDGSELNLHFICLVYLAFVVTVLYLNSPRLKLMIVNGECFFRYSKECTIQQEP
jgi:hypothetical protein